MSVHSDSDLIDVDLGENRSDVNSNYEGYECNKDMSDYTYINKPIAAENSQMPDKYFDPDLDEDCKENDQNYNNKHVGIS